METVRFALTLLLELVPLFFLVSAGVYLFVDTLTPERIRGLLSRRTPWLGVPLASALGAVTPFCSCSTVPLVNGMQRAGIPTAPMVAFLIASPLVHPVAVALLWTAIGMRYALLYTAAALGIAMGGGVLVGAWSGVATLATPVIARAGAEGGRGRGSPSATRVVDARSSRAAEPFRARVVRAFRLGWKDLRGLALPLVLAVATGATIHGVVPASALEAFAGPNALWAVPVAALLGIPVYASILVLLPLGTSLLAKGVGIGVVTAFLMGASGFSVPEGILLSKVISTWLLVRVLVVFSVAVVGIGYFFQWLVG